MKFKVKKDILYRKQFNFFEASALLNKVNKNALDLAYRRHSFFKVRIRNRCFLTGKGSSVYRDFHMSRMRVREFAQMGFFPGVKKANW